MDHKRTADTGLESILPAYFLVRTPETGDPAEVIRKTLRLGSKSTDTGRQWFVPVFTNEDAAAQLAEDVKKVDSKLRVVEISGYRDLVTILDALAANGTRYVAFDPQASDVQHVEISGLLGAARRHMGDEANPEHSDRASSRGSARFSLRGRAASRGPDSSQLGNGRARAEAVGRAGSGGFKRS